MASSNLNRLAINAGIAGLFLAGIGFAFVEGYRGFTRAREDRAVTRPKVDIGHQSALSLEGPPLVSTPMSLKPAPRKIDAHNPVSRVAASVQPLSAGGVVERTNVPQLQPGSTLPVPATTPIQRPPVWVVPSARHDSLYPANPVRPSWHVPGPELLRAPPPWALPPARNGFPPARWDARPRVCPFGSGR